jgi:hypothetical protein
MTTDKEAEPRMRTTRESEIFRDPPGSGNYSSSIGAAQGLELFSGSDRVRRVRPSKTFFPKPTYWWSAAARPERLPPSLPGG